MPRRPVTLVTTPWADQPLAQVAAKAAEWGYQGLELSCLCDHCDPYRLVADPEYRQSVLELLSDHDLRPGALHAHWLGQAVLDPNIEHHRSLLPEKFWKNASGSDLPSVAAEVMKQVAQAAASLGVQTVVGFTGSPVWPSILGPLPVSARHLAEGYRAFAERWNPILDAFAEAGVRFALHVSPGQIAFDYYSALTALDAVEGREEFGFALDPAHLHWQGVDPVEFLRRFRDRVFHVLVRDAAVTLDGRAGILGSGLPGGDARRGWQFRCPGRGGLDWEAILRALNDIGYTGPLAVAWEDPGMDRDFGAAEACQFVRRLDFEPASESPSELE